MENIKSIRHVLENWGPNIIRLFCLSGHYSKPIDYSEELLQENITKWRQVESSYYEMKLSIGNGDTTKIENIISESKKEFDSVLENDLNTHLALSAFFKFVNHINQLIQNRELLRAQKKFQDADKIRDQISQMGIVLIDHKNRTTWMKKEKIKSDNS